MLARAPAVFALFRHRCTKKTMGLTCTQAEGFVLGVGANMFKIAGPVIAYGTIASVVYGLIYWIIKVL